ncbi:hypothetical protein DFH07DRAFT_981215 [Mycena maculata]|uniref:Uncharacterized protein n=1 Tax=Mycena maculata TaxID=230809 RepID=A0AAD7N2N4_9AGAR|nr:hypothetical protein DFH07DRAFT_981215 [Mycena maculata]
MTHHEFYGPGLHGLVNLSNPSPAPRVNPILSLSLVQVSQVAHHSHPTRRVLVPSPNAPPVYPVLPPRDDARDKWHTNKLVYIPHRESFAGTVAISISFLPSHGPCNEGVAMTELDLSRGMLEPRKRVGAYIPARAGTDTAGSLVFTWPGYPNTHVREKLSLKDGPAKYVTRGALGKEVSRIFRKFIDEHGHEHVPGVSGRNFPLGENGIKHEQLRLLEVFSTDGHNFYVRVGVVPPRPVAVV